MMDASLAYIEVAEAILKRIREHEMGNIARAAEICAHTIANEGLVHMFATGHSRMMVEEMYPRHGSFAGFHPIVELSLTYHTQVVGANGQRQAMYLEHLEGFAAVILRNFVIRPPDSFLIFSNSGINEVVVEMALEAQKRGLPVIAVVSKDHSSQQAARHSSGKKLSDIADVTIDNGTPTGDALVRVEGLDDPVGPGSTVGAAAVTNALKCAVAERLAAMGKPPLVLTSSALIGAEESRRRFDASYDDYRRRVKRVYGCDE
jgi:uncharacterized phosphosugar-binding protein